MFPGPLSKYCFSSFSEEAIPNAQRAEKETAGSLWLTHFGHDLILHYYFPFLLQCFKNQGLALFLCIKIKYHLRNTQNTTWSYKRKYTALVNPAHSRNAGDMHNAPYRMSQYPKAYTKYVYFLKASSFLWMEDQIQCYLTSISGTALYNNNGAQFP